MDNESDMTEGGMQTKRFFISHILPSSGFLKEAGSLVYGKEGARVE